MRMHITTQNSGFRKTVAERENETERESERDKAKREKVASSTRRVAQMLK